MSHIIDNLAQRLARNKKLPILESTQLAQKHGRDLTGTGYDKKQPETRASWWQRRWKVGPVQTIFRPFFFFTLHIFWGDVTRLSYLVQEHIAECSYYCVIKTPVGCECHMLCSGPNKGCGGGLKMAISQGSAVELGRFKSLIDEGIFYCHETQIK